MNATFPEIAAALRAAQRIAVLSHVRPDGDAFGSQLALGLSLLQMGKDVAIWNEDGLLEKYSFLPGGELLVRPPSAPEEFELCVALDTATQNRLGIAGEMVCAPKWINLDHHPTNPAYGDLNFIDPISPATGQILYDFLSGEGFPIDPGIAENLFVAISTDTGSFQYSNTTARTFDIIGELVRRGVNVGRLSQLLYENYPRRRIELLRELLDTMHFDANGQVASFSLSIAMAHNLGALPEDNEGLIDHLRAIEGVVIAVFFEELPDGKVRVSMRSKKESADVAAIAQLFGGGGHTLAAGARVLGSLAEVERRILEAICNVIDCNS